MSERTILLRRSSLGDVVLLGSVTAALPGPVTVVTAPEYASIAEKLQGVDEVIAWPRSGAPTLPPGRIVDLHGTWRSWRLSLGASLGQALAPSAAPPFRPGVVPRIAKRSIQRRLRLWSPRWGARPTVPDLYAEACGVSPLSPPWIDTPGPRDRWVLAPGAAWATKQWDPAGFRAVIDRLDGPVTLVGGPGEAALLDTIGRGTRAEILVEQGFTETIRTFGRAHAVLANDSGLLHLAAACGAPVVAIFGPTHPDDGFFPYAPWGVGRVVSRGLSCGPCSLRGDPACPRGHHDCMAVGPLLPQILAAMRECAG